MPFVGFGCAAFLGSLAAEVTFCVWWVSDQDMTSFMFLTPLAFFTMAVCLLTYHFAGARFCRERREENTSRWSDLYTSEGQETRNVDLEIV